MGLISLGKSGLNQTRPIIKNAVLRTMESLRFSIPIIQPIKFAKNTQSGKNQTNYLKEPEFMEQNEQGQYIIEFPQLYYQGQYFLSYQDFVSLSGMPKSNLARLIKDIADKPVINIKNRLYFRTDFCIKFHRWNKPREKN